jgi:transposase
LTCAIPSRRYRCFQLAEADERYRIVRRQRFSRTRFAQWMSNHPSCLVVMEAWGSAHYWARVLESQGYEVRSLPAQHVKAYVKRNKTDAADAAALIEASRCEEIKPVAVKSVEQQVLQQLHRLRTQWQGGRRARINSLRGMLREFGIDIPVGAVRGVAAIREVLEVADNGLPDALRPFIAQLLMEIEAFEEQMKRTEGSLKELTCEDAGRAAARTNPGCGADRCDWYARGDPRHPSLCIWPASVVLARHHRPGALFRREKTVGSDQQARGCICAPS